jgi:molybdopterin-guanine dinucleotide biosynthesis protein A
VTGYAAMLLAGGLGRRMGGVDKPALRVAGQSLMERVLAAVPDATPRIVVGPPRRTPPGVLTIQERPPGAGPAAAIAAGLELVPPDVPQVALFAADLPFLTTAAVGELRAAATADTAVFTDREGRRQFLCAVWRQEPLRHRLAALGPLTGQPLKRLYADAAVTELVVPGDPPPWYDCDTGADIDRAEAWLREGRTPTGD